MNIVCNIRCDWINLFTDSVVIEQYFSFNLTNLAFKIQVIYLLMLIVRRKNENVILVQIPFA